MTSTTRSVVLVLTGIIAMLLISSTYRDPEPATTIGGTEVPAGLNCEEDEFLGFHGVPDEIVCVHVDTIRGE